MSHILTQMEEYIKTPSLPSFVQFETSTNCNAKCTFCPHSKMKRHGQAKWSTLIKVIHELIPTAEFVAPFLMQEPFLEPRLIPILANIKQINPKSKTMIYSNMGFVEQEKIKKIVDYDLLDELHISFYGPNKRIYNQLQPPLSWEKTKENIKAVFHIRQKCGRKKPLIIMQYLVIPELMQYVHSFIRKWSKFADKIMLTNYNTFHGDMPKIDYDESKWLGNPAHRTPCQRLWSDINIHFDGTIAPCCIDWDNRMPLGNINETPVEKIWDGEKFRWLREMHTEKRWNEITMCRNCDVYKYQFTQEWIKIW